MRINARDRKNVILFISGLCFMGIGFYILFFNKPNIPKTQALGVTPVDYDYSVTYQVSSWLDIFTMPGDTGEGIDPQLSNQARVTLGPARWEVIGTMKDQTKPLFHETWYLDSFHSSNARGGSDREGTVSNFSQPFLIHWDSTDNQFLPDEDKDRYLGVPIETSTDCSESQLWNTVVNENCQNRYKLYVTKEVAPDPRDFNAVWDPRSRRRFYSFDNVTAPLGIYGLTRLESAGIIENSVDTDVDEALTFQPMTWKVYGKFGEGLQ